MHTEGQNEVQRMVTAHTSWEFSRCFLSGLLLCAALLRPAAYFTLRLLITRFIRRHQINSFIISTGNFRWRYSFIASQPSHRLYQYHWLAITGISQWHIDISSLLSRVMSVSFFSASVFATPPATCWWLFSVDMQAASRQTLIFSQPPQVFSPFLMPFAFVLIRRRHFRHAIFICWDADFYHLVRYWLFWINAPGLHFPCIWERCYHGTLLTDRASLKCKWENGQSQPTMPTMGQYHTGKWHRNVSLQPPHECSVICHR